ncbi:MAG: thioredoxin-disulfide reductase [Candidatus Omnitrophica bacterium]|nr:thioredoxin-disulfide reductase [Candidatus Omnitrophota bacterium]
MENIYDIVIIGGGPSGLTAGIYASRARMKTLLIEKMECGGQALVCDTIENFPGFPGGIKGPDLADWMSKQAGRFGLEIKTVEAKRIIPKESEKEPFSIELSEGPALKASAVVIATGAKWNKLKVPGEKELSGRGVSYCATCDGPLFKGKDVVVVGGGDTALEDAIFLTKFANKVTIVHRRDKLRAAKILQERAFASKKIEMCLGAVCTGISGKARVEAVLVKSVKTGEEKTLKADGVFVMIGLSPNSDIVKGLVDLCPKGYIKTDEEMKTSVDGIFACGDVRMKMLRQVVTATGDGAIAATSAEHYVERLKGTEYK